MKVSFIIPTLNSSRTIKPCLESIKSQNYPNFEIIIIDSSSKDNTIKIASEYTKKIFYSSLSYSQCRQMGINKSSGEILACFDSDIILPHKNWLVNAIKQFESTNNVGTVWPIQVALPNGPILQRAYLREQWGIIKRRVGTKREIIGGSNALFLKSCLSNVGSFESVNIQTFDDFYLASKLNQSGYSVIFYLDPVIHDTNISLDEFIRKQRERIRFLKKNNAASMMGYSLIELLYEYSIIPLTLTLEGLFIDKDYSSILIPLLIFIRLFLSLF